MQNKNNKTTKRITLTLFILYILAMLFLLIIPNNYRSNNVLVGGLSWERWSSFVANGFNIVPFRGITEQIGSIFAGEAAARNIIYLFGNIIGFFPLGFFLPVLFAKQRKFIRFIAAGALSIICVELLQLVTMRGSFDIDDVILNSIGACLGFFVLKRFVKRVIGQETGGLHNELKD